MATVRAMADSTVALTAFLPSQSRRKRNSCSTHRVPPPPPPRTGRHFAAAKNPLPSALICSSMASGSPLSIDSQRTWLSRSSGRCRSRLSFSAAISALPASEVGSPLSVSTSATGSGTASSMSTRPASMRRWRRWHARCQEPRCTASSWRPGLSQSKEMRGSPGAMKVGGSGTNSWPRSALRSPMTSVCSAQARREACCSRFSTWTTARHTPAVVHTNGG
mmetsp:Transcript_4966/g.16019  ORF Transcript_4966/g.16019 Transcript_4966/m.16019 type:complete len:220 (-) Transcript_4966:569-1228(-)